jgi:hypothetical protein
MPGNNPNVLFRSIQMATARSIWARDWRTSTTRFSRQQSRTCTSSCKTTGSKIHTAGSDSGSGHGNIGWPCRDLDWGVGAALRSVRCLSARLLCLCSIVGLTAGDPDAVRCEGVFVANVFAEDARVAGLAVRAGRLRPLRLGSPSRFGLVLVDEKFMGAIVIDTNVF